MVTYDKEHTPHKVSSLTKKTQLGVLLFRARNSPIVFIVEPLRLHGTSPVISNIQSESKASEHSLLHFCDFLFDFDVLNFNCPGVNYWYFRPQLTYCLVPMITQQFCIAVQNDSHIDWGGSIWYMVALHVIRPSRFKWLLFKITKKHGYLLHVYSLGLNSVLLAYQQWAFCKVEILIAIITLAICSCVVVLLIS